MKDVIAPDRLISSTTFQKEEPEPEEFNESRALKLSGDVAEVGSDDGVLALHCDLAFARDSLSGAGLEAEVRYDVACGTVARSIGAHMRAIDGSCGVTMSGGGSSFLHLLGDGILDRNLDCDVNPSVRM